MKLRVPPAVIFLLTALCMYLLAEFLPVGYFDFFGREYLMKALVILALIVSVAALVQFFRARTTVDPMNPQRASVLVTRGIFSISRNPMYLALLMVLLAWGLWLGNAFNVLLAAGFVTVMNRVQISREEASLLDKFGNEYRHYCLKVRRWF
ncbi:methyltransferase family protein [Muriicola jejuensis]|uniref:Isoprenylcysteine carboxylmethyltransferase family protein n=1 Tax=Muriicola jejuensis TaxID=504488 RepID=A0A6P0UD74_9FLAO|nr:isoprenylcysteine carboxylmethyltransferase family protein [Muriicola jejuensis]NER10997.1 isoprenylcysteine carboxylmethyltransferase family protein [Muriicola jejuensis]